MEKRKIIKAEELDFKIDKLRNIKRVDIYEDRLEIIFEVENGSN